MLHDCAVPKSGGNLPCYHRLLDLRGAEAKIQTAWERLDKSVSVLLS